MGRTKVLVRWRRDSGTGMLRTEVLVCWQRDLGTGMLRTEVQVRWQRDSVTGALTVCRVGIYEFIWTNTGRNKHFRKESHSPEAIASGRNVVLRKCFQPNRTTLKIAHFNKIITNRKWILHLHLYDHGYNNASDLRWSDGVFTSDRTKMTGRVLASLPSLFYWSCKIALIVSFWFRIFSVFLSFGLEQQEPTTKPSERMLPTNLLTALQEWPDFMVDEGKAVDAADTMVAAVPADKAVDRATQVSLKLPKWVSARN